MYMAQPSVAPLRREANGLGPLERLNRGHPHVTSTRENPRRNPVTDLSRPGHNSNSNSKHAIMLPSALDT